MTTIRHIIAVFIVFLCFSGCAYYRCEPNIFLKENFEHFEVKRIAVLPFYNYTHVKGAGKIVTKAFIKELFDCKTFEIEFPGNVKKLLMEERIIVRKGIGADYIKLIGKRLNVDAVVIGWVERYGSSGKKRDSQIPVVSINVRMIHTDSCSVIWIGQNHKRGDDYEKVLGYGRIKSAAALARTVAKELIETIP